MTRHRTRGGPLRRKVARGVVAIEMALVTPVLMVLALGVAQFGWLLVNYIVAANAASVGAQYFAGQRGTTTPYSSTALQVAAVVGSVSTNVQVVRSVNGTACSSDADCMSAMSSAQGDPATVEVSYSFSPLYSGNFMGLGSMMPANIDSVSVARVQ
jgi:Flp pilus assembly protein TadG